MKYLAMIQARCGSSRLPNKVLKDLCGKPVIQRVIEKVQKSKYVDDVIVITSIDVKNLPILKICADMGVKVGTGSENDVLDRFYQTAKLINPEYVIRITADCPCFDSQLLDNAIKELHVDTDYLGMLSETFADGLDFEIIKFVALKKAWEEAVHTFEREHVTQYIIRNPDKFKLQDFVSPIGYFGNYRWTVDEPDDYKVVLSIYKYFIEEIKSENFTYKDILLLFKRNPELSEINRRFRRNEGLQNSIREDRTI